MRHALTLACSVLLTACGSSSNPGEQLAQPTGDCLRPPNLSIAPADLDAALQCTDTVATTGVQPILLVPGTATTPESAFSWNYVRAFTEQARPFCTLTLPDSMLIDV